MKFFSLCLLALSITTPALAGTVESDIQRIENIVVNNLPAKYRPSLMLAIANLRQSADQECSAFPPVRPEPNLPMCKLQMSNSHYSLVKNGSQLTAWNRDLDEVLTVKKNLMKNRICSSQVNDTYCDLMNSNGHYAVKVDNAQITAWNRDMNEVIQTIAKLRDAGVCM